MSPAEGPEEGIATEDGSGPAVVALGGGHGTAVTLRAARYYARRITAIVSVADDGGSSGRLRQAFGIPAPGDLRRCLVALAGDSPLARAFEHRFDAGELHGHALGNLVIAGLTEAMGGFLPALEETARLLGSTGQVLPATCDPVVLKAESDDGPVQGQVNVAQAGRISHVSLVPPDPQAPLDAITAIGAADQIVLGPGSLFTSVIATIVVPAVRDALAAAAAPVVYVANLAASSETRGYDVAAHVDAIVAHGVVPDVVVYDPTGLPAGTPSIRTVAADLRSAGESGHDPVKLAKVLSALSRPASVHDEPGQ